MQGKRPTMEDTLAIEHIAAPQAVLTLSLALTRTLALSRTLALAPAPALALTLTLTRCGPQREP